MWSAILRARGFAPSFVLWWESCEFHAHGAPCVCPQFPPQLQVANAMFDTMVMAARALETELLKESRQYAKMRRAQQPHVIFRDVKEPAASGPEVLARSLTSTVEHVDHEQSFVSLVDAQDWSDQPILCNGKQLPVIHAEGDGIWLESVSQVQPGMTVAQIQLDGSFESLSREFISAWKHRWQRHANVPSDRWAAVIAFARQHLPRGHFQWPTLDVPSLQRVIKSKKARTSGGPDGVSLADLKAMPTAVLENFCSMFAQAEMTGEWPAQVVSGMVSSLAKTSAPASALDFRPITVLGLLYRCWSSHHAYIALRKLDGSLPAGLAGSRPNKFAGQIWASLLWEIEQAYSVQADLGGVIADVQKAFNHIPRLAIMEICAHVGLPCSLLLGWSGALTSMARRFQIREHVSEPVYSCTGVPEGCALSCVAMIVIDWSLHAWFQHMMPLSRPLTYVDDWQIITTDSHNLQLIMDNLVSFADMFDLPLDSRKTYSWSITASGRSSARGCGFRVVSRTKNLGAHVQFTRQHTNSILVERVQSLQLLWPKLRVSAPPYRQKLRAILAAAWPKGLHAIAATTLSSQWYQSLRAGAIKGLNVDGAGCNAHLHLGLVEVPLHDPQFWSIMHTFWFVRDCGDPSHVEYQLAELVSGSSSVPENSITSTLLVRLQVLGWHVTPTGAICDSFGSFSLFDLCKQELGFRASRAWQRVVAAEVSHRKGFDSLHRVDPQHVRDWLRMLSCSDRALFQRVLNGSHFTQDVVSFSQPGVGSECVYCGSTDSRYHRFWQCEFFHEQRAEFPPSLWPLLPSLPEVLTSFGWSLRPHTDHTWFSMLAQYSVHPAPALCANDEDVIHLFTDGSCLFQHDANCRFAAWGVICAPSNAQTIDACKVVDSGPLPGIVQNAYRAEVYAILRALECCRHVKNRLCLWTDCEAVAKRLRKYVKGVMPKPNSPHADLWIAICQLLAQRPTGHVGVFKVAAHQNAQAAGIVLKRGVIVITT